MEKVQDKKIKLLIVTHTLDKGGLEEIIRTYARLLDKRKFTVIVAYAVGGFVSSGLRSLPGVRMVPVDIRSRPMRLLRLWSLAREFRPDIVHNHFSWYGLLVGMLTGAKRVETIHNVYDWFTWWQRHSYAAYCLLANRIIAVSEIVRRFTVQHFPLIREDKIIVIHNGIDVDRFHSEAGSGQLRSELGLSGSEVVIGFAGRLEDQKGVTYLLDAAHRLGEQHHNFTLIVLGDGSLASALRDKAVALHLSNTLFLGFRADAARYFSVFDIYALPSLYEGLPLSVLEAMASECPVVASSVGGVPEVVEDGVTGFLVAPKKVDELVDRLQKLIQNEDLRIRLGKAGRERVVHHFSAASMVAKTEDVYKGLLLGKSHSREK